MSWSPYYSSRVAHHWKLTLLHLEFSFLCWFLPDYIICFALFLTQKCDKDWRYYYEALSTHIMVQSLFQGELCCTWAETWDSANSGHTQHSSLLPCNKQQYAALQKCQQKSHPAEENKMNHHLFTEREHKQNQTGLAFQPSPLDHVWHLWRVSLLAISNNRPIIFDPAIF